MSKVKLEDSQFIKLFCAEDSYGNIPTKWVTASFDQVIGDATDSKAKLLSSEMKEEGQFPVIDQGQRFISGYTDRSELVRKFDSAVIVFGDHTRAFKYVDFPFVQGADGTKVLIPKARDTAKFLFYFLKHVNLPNKGYARHYKYLKQLRFPLCSISEQKRIVAKIESTQEKVETIESNISEAEELIEKYRESLLQKAFRGELVPQDPNDEPTSNLIERLRSERAKQADRKKNKKDELPAIKPEDIPFEIPKSWEWVKFEFILDKLTDGTHHSPPNLEKGDFKYISAKNIKDWGIDLTKITFVSKKVHDEIYSRCDPRRGDVLLIKDGATTGIATINSLEEPFSMLSSVALLRPSMGLKAEYLLWYLKSSEFQSKILGDMAGAAIKRVTLSKLANMSIPLPPINEQNRIISEVHTRIASAQKAKNNLVDILDIAKSLNSSILTKAFTGSLVPQMQAEGSGHDLLEKMVQSRAVNTEKNSSKASEPKLRATKSAKKKGSK